MKTIYKIAFGMLCICGLLLGACTDFEELNTDPSKSSSTDPNQQLSMIQLQTWGHWQMCQPYPFRTIYAGRLEHHQLWRTVSQK